MKNENEGVSNMLPRKIVTAIISSFIYSVIISLNSYFELSFFIISYFLCLTTTITLGMITSMCCDWLSKKLFKNVYVQESISLSLHGICGIVFLPNGLVMVLLYFIVDRLFKRVKISWLAVVIALLIFVSLFIGFIIYINTW